MTRPLFDAEGAAWSERPAAPPPPPSLPETLAGLRGRLDELIDEAVERDRDEVLRLAEWMLARGEWLTVLVARGDAQRARQAAADAAKKKGK